MQLTLDKHCFFLWIKRFCIYLAGLYLMATGVVFSVRSGLGVSPVGSIANVLYQIGRSSGAPDFINLGNCTTAIYFVYILVELIILRKDFKPSMLLQIVASLLFGQLVNIATAVMGFLPEPAGYAVQMLYLISSIPCVALGVLLYLSPNILPTPGDGIPLAISKKSGLPLGTSKIISDCTLVVIAAVLSLLYFHQLTGVREGTLISAIFVGFVMKQIQRGLQPALLGFVERKDKVSLALQALEAGYTLDSHGKPKIIVTIGREFGAGGYEIGERLAKRLGIPFYDKQLNEMASEMGNVPMSQINEMEKRMERSVIYDFKNIAYTMTNGALSPEEEVFVAQTGAIRAIAARDESCVIMGRCADYVLYNDPNCFRVFIHARPDVRIARAMAKFDLGEEEARKQMNNTDKSRSQHYKTFTGREYGKQEYYHLGLDSGMLGVDESVEVILDTLRRWCDVRGSHPLTLLN